MKKPIQFIEAFFDLTAKLPIQVFRRSDGLAFSFADAAILTAPEGWECLKCCARHFGDDFIFGAVVDYAALEGTTESAPILRISPDATRELFINWLDHEGTDDNVPLHVDARILAFTGSTETWGLWIEQDRELAVIGVSDAHSHELGENPVDPLIWLPTTHVADLLEPSFYPDAVPQVFLNQLETAYGTSRSSKKS